MHFKCVFAVINAFYYQHRYAGSNISLIISLLIAVLYHFNLLEEAPAASYRDKQPQFRAIHSESA